MQEVLSIIWRAWFFSETPTFFNMGATNVLLSCALSVCFCTDCSLINFFFLFYPLNYQDGNPDKVSDLCVQEMKALFQHNIFPLLHKQALIKETWLDGRKFCQADIESATDYSLDAAECVICISFFSHSRKLLALISLTVWVSMASSPMSARTAAAEKGHSCSWWLSSSCSRRGHVCQNRFPVRLILIDVGSA